MCIGRGSPEKHDVCAYVHIFKRFILRSWLVRLWGQASWKCVGQVSRLETWAGADAAVLRRNVFFAEKPVLRLRPLAN